MDTRPQDPRALTRILVVDNEQGMLEVCTDTLARLDPPAEVVARDDPRHAVQLLELESFDLLISNLQMPGMSGIRLLQHVREHVPALPVLIVTGYATAETARRCRELGVVGYLTKPFLPRELLSLVAGVLGGAPLRDERDAGIG